MDNNFLILAKELETIGLKWIPEVGNARAIADRRIRKGRTARFDCDCGIVETIERAGAGVARWFTGANEKREKAEYVVSADIVD